MNTRRRSRASRLGQGMDDVERRRRSPARSGAWRAEAPLAREAPRDGAGHRAATSRSARTRRIEAVEHACRRRSSGSTSRSTRSRRRSTACAGASCARRPQYGVVRDPAQRRPLRARSWRRTSTTSASTASRWTRSARWWARAASGRLRRSALRRGRRGAQQALRARRSAARSRSPRRRAAAAHSRRTPQRSPGLLSQADDADARRRRHAYADLEQRGRQEGARS